MSKRAELDRRIRRWNDKQSKQKQDRLFLNNEMNQWGKFLRHMENIDDILVSAMVENEDSIFYKQYVSQTKGSKDVKQSN
jgi:hypothetical protein